jgi:hypothetical protein
MIKHYSEQSIHMKKEKQQLPINDVLNAINTRNFKYIGRLSDDEKKLINPWLLMRFASSCNSNYSEVESHYLTMTNDIVNLDFNELRKHPLLQFRLMQVVGIGAKQRHQWIAPMRGAAADKISTWLISLYPQYNDDEIEMLRNQPIEVLKTLAQECGKSDAELKELFKK